MSASTWEGHLRGRGDEAKWGRGLLGTGQCFRKAWGLGCLFCTCAC